MAFSLKGIGLVQRVFCLLLAVLVCWVSIGVPAAEAVLIEGAIAYYGIELIGTIMIALGFAFASSDQARQIAGQVWEWLVQTGNSVVQVIRDICTQIITLGISAGQAAVKISAAVAGAIREAIAALYSSSTVVPDTGAVTHEVITAEFEGNVFDLCVRCSGNRTASINIENQTKALFAKNAMVAWSDESGNHVDKYTTRYDYVNDAISYISVFCNGSLLQRITVNPKTLYNNKFITDVSDIKAHFIVFPDYSYCSYSSSEVSISLIVCPCASLTSSVAVTNVATIRSYSNYLDCSTKRVILYDSNTFTVPPAATAPAEPENPDVPVVAPATVVKVPAMPTVTYPDEGGQAVVTYPPLSLNPGDHVAAVPNVESVPEDVLVTTTTGDIYPGTGTEVPDVPGTGTDVDNPPGTDVDNPPGTDVDNPPGTDVDNPSDTDIDKPSEPDEVFPPDWFEPPRWPSEDRLDLSPLQNTILPERFPFCIPFDFVDSIQVFAQDAQDYQFNINLDTRYFSVHYIVDLAPYSVPIGFFRYLCVCWFCWVLMLRTRDLIKW